jgi:hypothetical protein
LEKSKLILDSIKIINKLAENKIGDCDGDCHGEYDEEELKNLVLKARQLTSNELWCELIKNK